jgi:NAD dependent epimerase/dehydratase family enzyme
VNASSPQPVTNAAFSRALGRALGRPSWLRAPALPVRLALGEMATMALTGQRAVPARVLEAGFRFDYSDIDQALRDIYR